MAHFMNNINEIGGNTRSIQYFIFYLFDIARNPHHDCILAFDIPLARKMLEFKVSQRFYVYVTFLGQFYDPFNFQILLNCIHRIASGEYCGLRTSTPPPQCVESFSQHL